MINIYSLPAKVAGVHTTLPGSSPPALTSLPSQGVGGECQDTENTPRCLGNWSIYPKLLLNPADVHMPIFHLSLGAFTGIS